jgi:hypothetical protein
LPEIYGTNCVVEGGSNLAGIDQEAGRVGMPKICANDFVMGLVGFRSDGGDSADYGLHGTDSCTIGVVVDNHALFPFFWLFMEMVAGMQCWLSSSWSRCGFTAAVFFQSQMSLR